jgi:group I intron endonuclease
MNIGIYQIKNLINNKIYIGSSINLSEREYKHFWMLSNRTHDNEYLQNSYNKYGCENFIFEVIELCDENELIVKENLHILNTKSNNSNFGYNLALVNDFRRNKYNDSVKIKLSKHNLNKNGNFIRFKLISLEDGSTIIYDDLVTATNYLIENGYAKGKPRNVRMKLSASLRGKVLNNGHKGSVRKSCYKHKFEIIN